MTKPIDKPAIARDELWDANDVARYLKVSRSWVYYRAEAGLLPCLRVGGLVRFEPDIVRAFARGEIRSSKAVPSSLDRSGRALTVTNDEQS